MKNFAATIAISAPPERIWAILTDASLCPKLDPAISKVEGRIALGEHVTVHANGRAFRLKVAPFTPHQRMIWSGGMPLGLFTGTRVFTLTPIAGGAIEFAMREDYTGLLAPLFAGSIADLQPSFDAFAANLKSAAEASR